MAEPSPPTGDGPLPDVLAQRALTRQRAQAWEKGDSRVPARRLREPVGGSGAKDAQPAAPWDQRRELARALGQNPDDPADRGPGLARGRDRPGPTPFDPRTGQRELRRMVADNGWAGKLAVAGVVARWPTIVGEQVAALHHRVLRRRTHHPARLVVELGPAAPTPPAHHRGQDR